MGILVSDSRIVSDDIWGILTVYQEASGETYLGKVAVAEVILRRTAQKLSSDGTVASTVLWPKQFSGWNSTDPTRIKSAKLCYDGPKSQDCLNAWQEAKQGSNYTKGALYYYNPKLVKPDWAKDMKIVVEIGKHVFLVEN